MPATLLVLYIQNFVTLKKKTSPSVHIIKISDTIYSKFGENGELLQFTYKQLKLKSNLLEDNYQTKNEKDNKCLIC